MDIQEIKQRLTLAEVLHHYGLKPDKHLRLQCPFHEDKTPSLQVYYKTHTAYCFSSNCKTHGKSLDVIDFILHKENCTKGEAINKAVELIGGVAPKPTTAEQLTRVAVLTKMFTYFKNAVHNSKPARDYIAHRGLDFTKVEIGYNSVQFHHGTRKEEALIQSCIEVGLLSAQDRLSRTGAASYKPFAKDCICFALRNSTNQITGLYFRSTINNTDQRHFYLKDRQGLYPHYPKAETTKLILTESIIDAASLLELEAITQHYEILALYGTNSFTDEHAEAVSRLTSLEEIIFFLNGDEPGTKAVAKYAPMLKAAYPKVKITAVAVPQNEDVNSLLQGHRPEVLTHLIDTRIAVQSPIQLKDIQHPLAKEVDFIFSTEKEKSPETPIPTEIQATQEVTEQPTSGLNTQNPYNLKYKGNQAQYQIKGFRTDQLDSLKITLQITI